MTDPVIVEQTQTRTFVCDETELPRDGSVITRSVKGRTVALAWASPDAETVVAFNSRCPHMQAPLKFGRVTEGEVVCPWHFLRFDASTGALGGCDKSILRLETFVAERSDEKIFVHMNE